MEKTSDKITPGGDEDIKLANVIKQTQQLNVSEYLMLYLHLSSQDTLNIEKLRQVSKVIEALNPYVRPTSKPFMDNLTKEILQLPKHVQHAVEKNLLVSVSNGRTRIFDELHFDLNLSYSIIWCKTNFVVKNDAFILKQEVYLTYLTFCDTIVMAPLSSGMFTELLQSVFPDILLRRKVGPSRPFGYRNLSLNLQEQSSSLLNSVANIEACYDTVACQLSCADYCSIIYSTIQPTKKPANNTQLPSTKELTVNECSLNDYHDKSEESYRSGQLNGQAIIVHDPLALLNATVNEKGTSSSLTSKEALLIEKERSRSLRLKNFLLGKRKKKITETRHKSINQLIKKDPKLILPTDLYKINVSPQIALNPKYVINWYAKKFLKLMDRASNICTIRGNFRSNEVKYLCCGIKYDVGLAYFNQIEYLKAELSHLNVLKANDSSDYSITSSEFDKLKERYDNTPIELDKETTKCDLNNDESSKSHAASINEVVNKAKKDTVEVSSNMKNSSNADSSKSHAASINGVINKAKNDTVEVSSNVKNSVTTEAKSKINEETASVKGSVPPKIRDKNVITKVTSGKASGQSKISDEIVIPKVTSVKAAIQQKIREKAVIPLIASVETDLQSTIQEEIVIPTIVSVEGCHIDTQSPDDRSITIANILKNQPAVPNKLTNDEKTKNVTNAPSTNFIKLTSVVNGKLYVGGSTLKPVSNSDDNANMSTSSIRIVATKSTSQTTNNTSVEPVKSTAKIVDVTSAPSTKKATKTLYNTVIEPTIVKTLENIPLKKVDVSQNPNASKSKYHSSVRQIFQKYRNVLIPKRVLTSNVDPVVVLNSGEVWNWYSQQLDNLRSQVEKTSPYESQVAVKRKRSEYHSKKFSSIKKVAHRNRPSTEAKINNSQQQHANKAIKDNAIVAKTVFLEPEHQAKKARKVDNVFVTKTVFLEPEQQVKKAIKISNVETIARPVTNSDFNKTSFGKEQSFQMPSTSAENNVNLAIETLSTSAESSNDVTMDPSDLRCIFCMKEFLHIDQLNYHQRLHYYCRRCKRRLRNADIMMIHLEKHCIRNSQKNRPRIVLTRVDDANFQSTDTNEKTIPQLTNTGTNRLVTSKDVPNTKYLIPLQKSLERQPTNNPTSTLLEKQLNTSPSTFRGKGLRNSTATLLEKQLINSSSTLFEKQLSNPYPKAFERIPNVCPPRKNVIIAPRPPEKQSMPIPHLKTYRRPPTLSNNNEKPNASRDQNIVNNNNNNNQRPRAPLQQTIVNNTNNNRFQQNPSVRSQAPSVLQLESVGQQNLTLHHDMSQMYICVPTTTNSSSINSPVIVVPNTTNSNLVNSGHPGWQPVMNEAPSQQLGLTHMIKENMSKLLVSNGTSSSQTHSQFVVTSVTHTQNNSTNMYSFSTNTPQNEIIDLDCPTSINPSNRDEWNPINQLIDHCYYQPETEPLNLHATQSTPGIMPQLSNQPHYSHNTQLTPTAMLRPSNLTTQSHNSSNTESSSVAFSQLSTVMMTQPGNFPTSASLQLATLASQTINSHNTQSTSVAMPPLASLAPRNSYNSEFASFAKINQSRLPAIEMPRVSNSPVIVEIDRDSIYNTSETSQMPYLKCKPFNELT